MARAWGGFGRRNGHGRRPCWLHEATLVGLGLPFGSLWGALGVTLGAKKATMEAPRRVTGSFGDPTGLWKGPGVILGVVLGSKKDILRCQNLEIQLAGPMESQYLGCSTLETKMDDFGSIWGGSGADPIFYNFLQLFVFMGLGTSSYR